MNEHFNANSPDTRRNAISELLNREGEQSVESLASRFEVSGMTIRRDLADLVELGRIIRTHGGAAPAARISFEFKFLERSRQQTTEKEQIAAMATSLVQPGQTVLLDSSTTTLAIARQLRSIRPLTVLTSSLPIASELFACQGITTILLGGQLRQDSPDLVGALAERMIEYLRADIAFLGADAVDAKGNVYNAVPEIGALLEKMADISNDVYAVADHTKVGRNELTCFAHLRDWTGLITDAGLDEDIAKTLQQNGVRVLHGEVADQHQHQKAALT